MLTEKSEMHRLWTLCNTKTHLIQLDPVGRYQRMQEMLFSDSPKECHDIPGHPTLCLMFEAVGRWFFFQQIRNLELDVAIVAYRK